MQQHKIEVENVNHPGKTARVDADKYAAMRAALEATLPRGVWATQAELRQIVLPRLPDHLFPGGATSGWWAKTVQLDLEAKGLLVRDGGKPLRWGWVSHDPT